MATFEMENSKQCNNCGRSVDSEFSFCPYCGTRIGGECSNCGKVLPNDVSFCPYCGEKVENSVQGAGDGGENTWQSSTNCSHEEGVNRRQKTGRYKFGKAQTVKIVRSAIVLTICILMFAFSFCSVASMHVDDYTPILGDCEVSLSSIDLIELMIASTKRYSTASAIGNMELQKMQADISMSFSKFTEAADEGNIEEAKKYLVEYTKKTLIYTYSRDDLAEGDRVSVFFAGVLSIVNILFMFVLLVFATISFSMVMCNAIGNKAFKTFEEVRWFLPLTLITLLLILFATADLLTVMTVAGATIAGLFFASLYILASFVESAILYFKNNKNAKPFIQRALLLVLCVVVIGCCFAPAMKGTFNIQKQGETFSREYKVDIGACAMSGILRDKDTVNQLESGGFKYLSVEIGNTFASIRALDPLVFDNEKLALKHIHANQLIQNSVLYSYAYSGAAACSVGYYVLFAVVLCAGTMLCSAVYGLEKGKGIDKVSGAIMLVALILAVVFTAITCNCVSNTMNEFDNQFDLKIGATLPITLCLGVAIGVVAYIPKKFWERTKAQEE